MANKIINNIREINKKTKLKTKTLQEISNSLSSDEDEISFKTNKFPEDKIESVDKIANFDSDSSDSSLKKFSMKSNASKLNDKIKKRINKIDDNLSDVAETFIKKKIEVPKRETKKEIIYKINPIQDYLEYFNLLDKLPEKNERLTNFIDFYKKINETLVIDNLYFKELNKVINNYKLVIGNIVYLKEYDVRTSLEISDIFNIINFLIYSNKKFLENVDYLPYKKNYITDNIIQNINSSTTNVDKSAIVYNMYKVNELNVFIPTINLDNFCYLKKYVNLIDVVNTIFVSWYILFLHIILYKNIDTNTKNLDEDEVKNLNLDLKKVKDKCLNFVTDSNIYLKHNINFIKRKVVDKRKNVVGTKQTKLNEININTTLKNTNIMEDIKSDCMSLYTNNLQIEKSDDEDDDDNQV